MKRILLMAIVLASLLTYVSVSAFTLVYQVPKDGYIIESENVYESLTEFTKLNFSEVSQDDAIYKRANRLYLNKTSFEFSENYPLILKNVSVVNFFNDSAVLIARDFYQNKSFSNMYLASGISFNEDFSQADYEEYILARLADGSYLNAQLIKVETSTQKIYIDNSSFIHFDSNRIVFESIKEGKVVKDMITSLFGATISIGQNKFSYADFYNYLQMAKNDPSFTIDDNRIQEDPTMPSFKPNEIGGAHLTTDENGDVVLDKDTVTITDAIESEDNKKDDSGNNNSAGDNGANGEAGSNGEINNNNAETSDNNNQNPGLELPPMDGDLDVSDTTSNDENQGDEQEGGTVSDAVGISREPIVKVGEFTPWVYSAGGKQRVYDFSARIIGSIKYTVLDANGKTVARKSVSGNSDVVLSVLPPDTDLTIRASYRYYNNNGEKVETGKNGIPVLFEQRIHTLDLSHFTPLEVNVENADGLLATSLSFKNLTLKNQQVPTEETTLFERSKMLSSSYVSTGFVIATASNGSETVLQIPASTISKLKQGKTVDLTIGGDLASNTAYTYEFKFYDKYENQIKTNPAAVTGESKTQKKNPVSTFNLLTNEAGNITVSFNIADIDSAILAKNGSNYRFRVKNEDEQYALVRADFNGQNDTGIKYGQEIALNDYQLEVSMMNLPFNKYLTIELIADIDLNDDNGLVEDAVIGTYSFFSSGVVSGNITYNTVFGNLGGTYATAIINITPSSNIRLLQLMTDMKFTFTDQNNNVISFKLNRTELENISFANGNMTYENGGITISEGSLSEKQPRIRLVGDYDLFAENAWQALLSGGYSNSNYVSLHIEFLQETLEPSTLYRMNIQSLIEQGLSYYNIETINKNREFSTLKREPIVHYDEMMQLNNSIQFTNLYITDEDATVLQEPVVMELVWNGIIMDTRKIFVGEDNKIASISFTDLMDDEQYTVRFKAVEFNNGLTMATYARNYVFKKIDFVSNSGIVGKLTISELTPTPSQIKNGVEVYDLSKNLLHVSGTDQNITYGAYRNYRGDIINQSAYFYTDYIAIDKSKPLTLFFYKLADESYHGNNPDESYHGSRPSFSVTYYEYDAANDKYNYLGYDNYIAAGDFIDFTTKSYASRIDYITFSGVSGYEDVGLVLQGIEPYDIIKPSDYADHYLPETYINGGGNYVANSSYTVIDYAFEVKPGEIYRTNINSNFQNAAFYDAKGRHIQTNRYYQGSGYLDYGAFDGNLIVVPNNAATMKITMTTSIVNSANFANDQNYYIKKLFTAKDDYYATLTVDIEDNDKTLALNSSYVIKTFVNKTDLNKEGDMVTFKPDHIQIFKTDNEQTLWTYLHDFQLDIDKYYRFELYLESDGKEYPLDKLEMYTETDWEYIYNFSQLSKIYTNEYGKYKVMADIDVPEGTISGYRPVVQGILDFNGHKFNMRRDFWGFDVGPDGMIMNAVVNYEFPSGTTSAYNSFVYVNYGIVKNCIVTVNSPLNYKLTGRVGMLVYQNYFTGTIENCATILNNSIFVEVEPTLTYDPSFSTLNYYNYGDIRNCYVAATNSDTKVYINNSADQVRKVYFGGLIGYNEVSGKLTNSFAILNTSQRTDAGLSSYTGTITYSNAGNVANCFAVGDRYTFIQQSGQLISAGFNEREFIPATPSDVASRFANCYSFTNPSLDYSAAKQCGFIKGDARNLLAKDWYEKTLLLDSYDFEIENSLLSGFYPRLKFNSNMMKYQPFIAIGGLAEHNQNMRVVNTVVDLQEQDKAEATIYIHNPNRSVIQSIEVKDLQAVIIDTSYDDTTYCSVIKVRLTTPQKYVSSYNITGINYQSGNAILSVSDSYPIECEFYRNISNVNEWGSYVNNGPNENYRICADLDFANVTNENLIRVWKQFTGKIDGEYIGLDNKKYRHTLSNITMTSNSYVFNDLRGSISNLDIVNLRITSGKNKTGRTGFVGYMYGKNAVLDNVHIVGSTIYGYNEVGALVAYEESATVKNCSVTNTNIYDNKPRNDNSSVTIGGLVGYLARGAVITNSFVSDINITVSDVKKVTGVGGIVGRIWYARVENCYSEGKLSNYSTNTGGIVGYNERSVLRNVYSNMNIEGSDVIGGIVGYDYGNDPTNHRTYSDFDNMLSMSDIYVKNGNYFQVHRLFGTSNFYGDNFYGTKNQIISPIPQAVKDIKEEYAQHGQILSDQEALALYEDDTWGLLTNSELGKADIYRYKVMMGEAFDYIHTESSRTLPVLKYTDSQDLLPYQDEKFLPLEGVGLSLASAVYDANSDTYTTTFIITHPEGYYADETSAVISDMTLKTNNNGETFDPGYNYYPDTLSDRIVLRTEKLKALDSYMFSISLKSSEAGSTFEQKLNISFAYESGPVYWQIPNYSTWKEVMSRHGQTGENFKITGTIDFNNEVFDYYNLSVNKIIGTNESAAIKNVRFTDKTDSEGNRVGFYNLFANVLSTMSNIRFEDIQYDMSTVSSSGNYVGLIGQCNNIENVSFKNVEIILPNNNVSYGGVIAYLSGNGINLDFNNITIRGSTGITRTASQSYIGSIGGLSGGLIDCDFDNIKIDEDLSPDKVRTHYVGAAVGYFRPEYLNFVNVSNYDGGTPDTYSLKVTNSIVNGYQRVGGAIGYGSWNQYGTTFRQLENVLVENVAVKGMNYVGGYQGQYNATRSRLTVKNVTVQGSTLVGGIASELSNYLYDSEFNNINVVGGYRVGGVSGFGQGYLYRSTISDITVHGGLCVGGLTGKRAGYQLTRDVVMDNIQIYGVNEKTLTDTYGLVLNTDQAVTDGFPTHSITVGNDTVTYVLDGSYVGGISGYHNGIDYATQFVNSTMTNVIVDGNNYVGGLYGAASGWYSYRSTYDIKTTGNDYVGGLIGYVFAGKSNWKHFQQIYVRNEVSGNNYVGGVAGFVEDGEEFVGFPTNGDSHNQNYSVILDLSLEARASENVAINYFANVDNPTVPVGAIDQLRYVDKCRMKAGADSTFIAITNADIANIMTAQDDATTANKYQAKILKTDDLMNFYELFGNRLYTDHLEFNTTIWDYNEDLLLHSDDYQVTKTGPKTFEVSGLNPGSEYTVETSFDDRKTDDEGLILYFDGKNNTGSGGVTSDSDVWKNLGSLGSDYDLRIIMKNNGVDASSRYKWENGGLRIVGNGGGTIDGKRYEGTYSQVALISDREKGRLEMTDSQEYTISVTYLEFTRNASTDLFGTVVNLKDYPDMYSNIGPTLYKYNNDSYFQTYVGKWGKDWLYGYNHHYSANEMERYYTLGRPITLTTKFEHIEKNIWRAKTYLNNIVVYETTGNNGAVYGGNNYVVNRLTDGFLHMLCRPTLSLNEDNIELINYGFQAFAGTIYSARMYDRALSDQEIVDLYHDEMGYYGLNTTDSYTVMTANDTVVADANGVVTINLDSSEKGNLKVKLTETATSKSGTATLSNVTPNSTCMPVSAYSKKPGSDGSVVLTGKKITADSVWLKVEGSDVKWYRSTANKYDGVEVGEGKELYVSMRGYYYAVVDGVQTEIIYLDSPLTFMQLYGETIQTAFIKGSEGRDDTGAWNPVDDVLVNGGVRIKQFITASSASLMNAFGLPANFIDEELPMLYAYSSGVDTVNLELAYVPENPIYVSVNVNGENVIDTVMDNQTLTFNYDYKTPFMVTWSDGNRSSYKNFDAIAIRNSVSTYGDNYYYLTSRGIGSNKGDIELMATHIYQDEVITYDDKVVNLNTSESRNAATLWAVVADKPLFEFEYEGDTLKTFYTYSSYQGIDFDQQAIIYDGEYYGLDCNMSDRAKGFIIDTYQNKIFVSSVYDGELINWYHNIVKPAEFNSMDIREISCSIESNNPIVLVRYNNGSIVGFNYTDGTELELFSEVEYNFVDYVASTFSSMFKVSKSSALQGAYAYALSTVEALDASENVDVIELFSLAPESDKEGTDKGIGYSVHDTKVKLVFDAENEEFVIDKVAGEFIDGKGNSTGHATSSGQHKTDGVNRELQDKFEEIAEKNSIPGLSSGIKGNTGKVTNDNSVVQVVFVALMAVVSVSAIIAVLSRFTRGKLW